MKCGCRHHDSFECAFLRVADGIFCNCICHQLARLGEPSAKLAAPRDWWKTVEWRSGRWDPMSNAPARHGEKIRGRAHTGEMFEPMHFASDLSGEEQPPFHGWFVPLGEHGFTQVHPVEWQPLTACPEVAQ